MTLSAARNDSDESASMQPANEANSRGIRSDDFMGHPFDWCSLDLHSRRVGNGARRRPNGAIRKSAHGGNRSIQFLGVQRLLARQQTMEFAYSFFLPWDALFRREGADLLCGLRLAIK